MQRKQPEANATRGYKITPRAKTFSLPAMHGVLLPLWVVCSSSHANVYIFCFITNIRLAGCRGCVRITFVCFRLNVYVRERIEMKFQPQRAHSRAIYNNQPAIYKVQGALEVS